MNFGSQILVAKSGMLIDRSESAPTVTETMMTDWQKTAPPESQNISSPTISRDNSEFIEYIYELSKEYANRANILLLSNIGTILGKKFDEYPEILGEKTLIQFIRDNMSHLTDFRRSSIHSQKIGIVPKGSKLDFPENGGAAIASRQKERVNDTLWFSFTRPLDEGKKRFVQLGEDRLSVVDLDNHESTEDLSLIPLSKKYLSEWSTENPNRAKDVYDNFISWYNENMAKIHDLGKSKNDLLDQSSLSSPEDSSQISMDNAEMFFRVFSRLDRENLDKINIPLSVIMEIFKK